jgi:Cu+-exporting ATPase
LQRVKLSYQTFLISGYYEVDKLKPLFKNDHLHFNQSPQKKLNFISNQQKNGSRILMIGEGLNDAGALKQSKSGIATNCSYINAFKYHNHYFFYQYSHPFCG